MKVYQIKSRYEKLLITIIEFKSHSDWSRGIPGSWGFAVGLFKSHGLRGCPNLDSEVLLHADSVPVDLRDECECLSGSDAYWFVVHRAMVPNPSGNTWQSSIMILARRNRAARVGGRASRIYVLARFLDVSRDVDNLSDRRINTETRTLAKRATLAGSSCNSNCVTIATSQPVAKLPVWGVVCCDQIRELNFKVSNSHKEGAFNLVQETNSCGFGRIAEPVRIFVIIGSSPFALSPRIAQLEDPYFL